MDVYNIYRDTTVPWWNPFKFHYKLTRNGVTFDYTITMWGAKREIRKEKREKAIRDNMNYSNMDYVMVYEEQS